MVSGGGPEGKLEVSKNVLILFHVSLLAAYGLPQIHTAMELA